MNEPLRDLIEIIHFTENVSAKIHGLLDEAELYRTVKEEFAQSKRYTAGILLLTDDGSKLRIAETSLPPGKLKAGEKAAGIRLKGYKIDLDKSSIYSQVVREGKTLQVNVSDVIAELFPRPLANLISKTMGCEKKPCILTPLKRHGKIIGALAISSTELAEYFIPLMRNLAQYISSALELVDEKAERKRAKKVLAKERNLLRTIIDNLPDYIYVKDTESQFLIGNTAVARVKGVNTPDELVGKTDFDFHSQELAAQYYADEQEIIWSGQPVINREDPLVDEASDRRGWLLTTEVPLRDSEGKIVGLVGISRDITERKRMEEALRKHREHLEELVEERTTELTAANEQLQREITKRQVLEKNLQARVRELTTLYTVAEKMNHSYDLDEVLQLALGRVVEVVGMDSAAILLLNPSTGDLFLRAHHGCSPELIRAVSHKKADEGLMPRMLNSVLTIDNLSEVTKDRRVVIEKQGVQSLVSIPLKIKERVLGVMVMASLSPRALSSQELEVLAAIGNQVGVAVDRANLQAQELRAVILEERQAMAQQMHDDIVQTLAYLGLEVDSVIDSLSLAQNVELQAKLEGMRRTIEKTYEHVRSSILRLREDFPAHVDLRAALPEIISKFEEETGGKVELRGSGSQLVYLLPLVAFQAAYIIREALTNVRKHSGADSVQLTLEPVKDDMIEITIQDNGQGFDLDGDQRSGREGFGLRFMRERAERVGGSLRIESQPGQGTRVVVSLPSGKRRGGLPQLC